MPGRRKSRNAQKAIAGRDANIAGRDQIIADRVVIAKNGMPGVTEPAVPGLLPRDVSAFTGRRDELDRLTRLAGDGSVVVTAIGGTAGVGKTALAVHAAYQLLPRFPDGQLYADLRGYTEAQEPAEPGEVLEVFLRRLGISAGEVPAGTEERSGLLRQLLASRRVLMLLDNAATEAQVRPLLPGVGESLVLITSRSVMAGLEVNERIGLDALSDDEAIGLLAGLIGEGRAAAEPSAVAQVAGWCGRLPLALRIAGQLLAVHPSWPVAKLAGMLVDEQYRLQQLTVGDLQVRAAFDVSYAQLAEGDARLFRLLGLLPGPDFDASAAAAVASIEVETAGMALDRLMLASMVVEKGFGRFGIHDLLRLFARHLSQEVDDQATRDTAVAQLIHHYSELGSFLNACLDPRIRPSVAIAGARPGESLLSIRQVLAIFEAERLNMLGVIGLAEQRGQYKEVWMLSEDMDKALTRLWHPGDLIRVHKTGLAAARHVDDKDAEARALGNLGNAYGQMRRFDEAIGYLQQDLTILRQTGDLLSQGRALSDLGIIYGRRGEFQEVIDCYQDALKIRHDTGDREGEGITLNNLGIVYRHLRRFNEAVECHQAAREIFQETADQNGEFTALDNLGSSYREMIQVEKAIHFHKAALNIAREIGYLHGEGRVLDNLGTTYQMLGQFEEAIRCYQDALAIHKETDDRYGQAGALNNLGTAHQALRQFEDAIRCYQDALAIYREAGDRRGQGQINYNLGTVYQALRKSDRAVVCWRGAAEAMRDAGDLTEAARLDELAANANSRRRRRWRRNA